MVFSEIYSPIMKCACIEEANELQIDLTKAYWNINLHNTPTCVNQWDGVGKNERFAITILTKVHLHTRAYQHICETECKEKYACRKSKEHVPSWNRHKKAETLNQEIT